MKRLIYCRYWCTALLASCPQNWLHSGKNGLVFNSRKVHEDEIFGQQNISQFKRLQICKITPKICFTGLATADTKTQFEELLYYFCILRFLKSSYKLRIFFATMNDCASGGYSLTRKPSHEQVHKITKKTFNSLYKHGNIFKTIFFLKAQD